MGDHANKRFLIDPSDLPYVFLMVPNVGTPVLTIALRSDHPPHDGAIAGRFFDLLDLIGGALDGDALFFNRILRVTGDVEAVVALRNALDDFDGDLVDEILSAFGPLAPVGSAVLELARRMTGGSRT
ncbi:MAG: SCP2 sterol-binding domain-containing protein [Bauldia sp.]